MNAVQLSSQKSPSLPVRSTAEFGGNMADAEMVDARARRDDEVLCEEGQRESSIFDPYQ